MNTFLYDSVLASGLPVTNVCEVGVYLPESSNVLGWINDGTQTTLVECDPQIVEKLQEQFGALPNVKIHSVAIADAPGTLVLYRAGASTFGSNVVLPPAIVNDNYSPKDSDTFTVQCTTFDTLDNGNIDVLSVDIEGGEWNVLEKMRSKPYVISIETHGNMYTNPNISLIESWMKENRYGAWFRDHSDTVYRLGWTLPAEDKTRKPKKFARIKRFLRGR